MPGQDGVDDLWNDGVFIADNTEKIGLSALVIACPARRLRRISSRTESAGQSSALSRQGCWLLVGGSVDGMMALSQFTWGLWLGFMAGN